MAVEFCPKCGAKRDPGNDFCVSCGQRLSPGQDGATVAAPETKQRRSSEAEENLAHGQIVIVTARWILILAGFILSLWNPGETDLRRIRIQVGLLLVFSVVNFILHAQLWKRGPGLAKVTYLMSAIDLALIISLIILQGGSVSNIYVFYFIALLVLSVAFPLPATIVYTGGALFVYAIVAFYSGGEFTSVMTRLLMMAAVSFCGALYNRIETERRRSAEQLGLIARAASSRTQSAGLSGSGGAH